MKKNILLFIAVLCSVVLQAQDVDMLKSKRGVPILPQEGEWALGISANPFLSFLGNTMNSSTSNGSPSFNYTNNATGTSALFGKYMVNASTAYRGRFQAAVGTQLDKGVITKNEITPDVNYPAFTEDWRKTNSQSVTLAAGIEKRRGKSRVQGIYGGEVILGFTGSKQSYEYGNPMSRDFNAPATYDFGGNITNGNGASASSRVTERKNGKSIYAGVRGFVGVEYFIAPRFSIGGEFGYTIAVRTSGRTLLTTEQWNGNSNSTQTIKSDVGVPSNYFTFLGTSLDNLNGSINMLFYF